MIADAPTSPEAQNPAHAPILPFELSADELRAILETASLIRRAILTGERVRAIRESLGVTQIQLAEMLGVSQPQISRAENGDYEFSPPVAVKLLSLVSRDLASV